MRAAAWEVCEQSENVGAPTSGNDTTKMDTLVAAASDAVIADIPEFVREPPQSRRRTGYPSYSAEHRPPQARAEEQAESPAHQDSCNVKQGSNHFFARVVS